MSNNNQDPPTPTAASRQDILTLLDSFMQQIDRIRRILFGVSISAIVLAPLAIALSIYLLLHPSFFDVLDMDNEFGLVLSILLGAVILISGIWLFTGVKQYYAMRQWKQRYKEYQIEKEAIDKKIASQFGLNPD
jgi:ABC-type bacteriocin/lantibiotic exporter with double-glycine peptidase domain